MSLFDRTFALALTAAIALGGCAYNRPARTEQVLIDGGRGMENFQNMGGANWHAEPDAIVADSRPGNEPTYYLATKSAYKDFRLHAEFWISDDGNSGIYMRCTDVRPMTDRTCTEANIFDKRPDPTYATGGITWLVRAPQPIPKTGGKWNNMDITVKGRHIEVVLNGVKTAESDQVPDTRGVIGLQYAGGVVKFRKLSIQPL